MKAIISTTFDDNYFFFLPIVTYSWHKIGVNTICFIPYIKVPPVDKLILQKTDLVSHFTKGLQIHFIAVGAPVHKIPTYMQCSRLFGAAMPLHQDQDVLITGDVDMVVFNKEYFQQLNDGRIHVAGADLVPDFQFPICYIAMPTDCWRDVMNIPIGLSHQEMLDELLGHIDCENFRGNYWAKDQETIYNNLVFGGYDGGIVKHFRATPGTQFATRRADRDGWPEVIPPDIIDAHLPRPGYTPENFAKILNLFQTMYPEDDFTWMIDYRNEYVKLIQ